MVGTSTKVVALVTLILGVAYFVNTSALTTILRTTLLYGVNLQILFNVVLLVTMLVGALIIWNSRNQPLISKGRAKDIALADLRPRYPDAQNITIRSNLTKLEGLEWHLVGTMLQYGRVQEFNVWINCQNGNFNRMSWIE